MDPDFTQKGPAVSTRVQSWERVAEWPLTGTAVIFLLAYALPIVNPAVDDLVRGVCEVTVWIAWAIFALDYAMRLWLAERRWQFVKHNALDLAVVVLPLLRPLRLIRLVALLSILNRTGSQRLRGRVVSYAVGGTVLLVLIGALAVTEAEAGQPDAHIRTFSDGLWWALTTITTVGYGDLYPITSTGRFVAAALMLAGIALLGVVTATIASWLVEKVAEAQETEQAATRAQVEQLRAEVLQLRDEIRQLGPS